MKWTAYAAVVCVLGSLGPIIDLPAKVRQDIENFLGRGVVGHAIEAPVIDDPVAFMGLEGQHRLRVKVVHGDLAGRERDITISRLERIDPQLAWRLDVESDTWFGESNTNGDLVLHSTQNGKNGVVTRYSPPQPILVRGLRPGESRNMRIQVEVFDLPRPNKKKHTGDLNLTYTYIGAYEVTVPAGTFEAVLLEWRFEGKVGPASVKDDQYWFFARDVGPVARIDRKDMSALLVYRDQSKVAGVLAERR